MLNKLVGTIVVCTISFLVTGCDLHDPPTVKADKVVYSLSWPNVHTSIYVSEVCLDGVVYYWTVKDSITPKFGRDGKIVVCDQ